jgi:flagellar biosynthesis anti-sigma factor FlgM
MSHSMEETGMRIDSNPGAQGLSGTAQNTSPGTAPETRAASTTAVVGEDQAQFSGAHVQVQALSAQVTQMPEINQAKVDALRQSVLDGTYGPDTGDIADALLSDMIEPIAA